MLADTFLILCFEEIHTILTYQSCNNYLSKRELLWIIFKQRSQACPVYSFLKSLDLLFFFVIYEIYFRVSGFGTVGAKTHCDLGLWKIVGSIFWFILINCEWK